MTSQPIDAVIHRLQANRSGLLGLAILCLGCASEPSVPTTGSIRVSVLDVGNRLDQDLDGYTVAIDDLPRYQP